MRFYNFRIPNGNGATKDYQLYDSSCIYFFNVIFSNLFHKHSKPTHGHLVLRNLDPFLLHSRTAKKTTPFRTLPLRAMTFLRWSSQPRSPEPSWWQEGTTLLPHHQPCYYYYCRRQSFYNVKTIWHDSFWLLFCCEQLPQLIKREFVGACVCLVWFPLYVYNHNKRTRIHYVLVGIAGDLAYTGCIAEQPLHVYSIVVYDDDNKDLSVKE